MLRHWRVVIQRQLYGFFVKTLTCSHSQDRFGTSQTLQHSTRQKSSFTDASPLCWTIVFTAAVAIIGDKDVEVWAVLGLQEFLLECGNPLRGVLCFRDCCCTGRLGRLDRNRGRNIVLWLGNNNLFGRSGRVVVAFLSFVRCEGVVVVGLQ